MLDGTKRYCPALHGNVRHCAVQKYSVLHCAALYQTRLPYTLQHNMVRKGATYHASKPSSPQITKQSLQVLWVEVGPVPHAAAIPKGAAGVEDAQWGGCNSSHAARSPTQVQTITPLMLHKTPPQNPPSPNRVIGLVPQAHQPSCTRGCPPVALSVMLAASHGKLHIRHSFSV